MHNCNERFHLSSSGVERGEQSLALPSVSGLQSCQQTGQVALFGLNPAWFFLFVCLFFGFFWGSFLGVDSGSSW